MKDQKKAKEQLIQGSLEDITERKQAEEASAHAHRLLLALSQAA